MSSIRSVTAAATLLLCVGASGQPLTNAFTYQGNLLQGAAPATGPHDVRFRLYDAAAGGSQLGSTLCVDNATVTNGTFTAGLDFGPQFNGQRRWLEIEVRQDTGLSCGNAAGFTTLSPRQELSASPHTLYALNASAAATATNAAQLNGQSAGFYQNAANLTAGTLPGARLAGTYTNAVTLSNASNSFAGIGTGITGLNASNLNSGTLPSARLSGTYTNTLAFSSAANSFSGSGAGLTSLNASNIITGTLADGLHSVNIPRLNAANFFTASANRFAEAVKKFAALSRGMLTE